MNRKTAILIHLILWLIVAAVLIARPLFASRDGMSSEPAPAEEVASPAAVAAVAPLFSYQGELRNASGSAITNSAMPMSFRLFTAPSGGSACWLENRTVNVQNGQFNVVLGQGTAIPSSCVTGDAYLELVINGETLSPRELLTAVAVAVKANTLVAGAQTEGPVTIGGNLSVAGGNLILGEDDGYGGNYMLRLDHGRALHILPWAGPSYPFDQVCIGCGGEAKLTVNGPAQVKGDLSVAGGNLILGEDDGYGGNYVLRLDGSRTVHILPWAGPSYPFDQVCIGCGGVANLLVHGNLDLRGTCTRASLDPGNPQDLAEMSDECQPGSILSGAYVEANLMTNEELRSERIARFAEGDVLCWAGEQLEKCDQPNDRLVQAVAGADGKPIIVGAEQIRVLGPVTMGDILVASGVPGYAMVNNDPLPGTVIGQALEDFDGDAGSIKAMIRKW